jgi:hypothetical protein
MRSAPLSICPKDAGALLLPTLLGEVFPFDAVGIALVTASTLAAPVLEQVHGATERDSERTPALFRSVEWRDVNILRSILIWGAFAVMLLLLAGFAGWLWSLPLAPTSAVAPPIPLEETNTLIASLTAPPPTPCARDKPRTNQCAG